MPTIAILGTFDSKGAEHGFIADAVRRGGFDTLLINAGSLDAPTLAPDIAAEKIAAAADPDFRTVLARRDRGECVALMSRGAARVVSELAAQNKIQGIISLGGGGGT